jgi:hypothetical protein
MMKETINWKQVQLSGLISAKVMDSLHPTAVKKMCLFTSANLNNPVFTSLMMDKKSVTKSRTTKESLLLRTLKSLAKASL